MATMVYKNDDDDDDEDDDCASKRLMTAGARRVTKNGYDAERQNDNLQDGRVNAQAMGKW